MLVKFFTSYHYMVNIKKKSVSPLRRTRRKDCVKYVSCGLWTMLEAKEVMISLNSLKQVLVWLV